MNLVGCSGKFVRFVEPKFSRHFIKFGWVIVSSIESRRSFFLLWWLFAMIMIFCVRTLSIWKLIELTKIAFPHCIALNKLNDWPKSSFFSREKKNRTLKKYAFDHVIRESGIKKKSLIFFKIIIFLS